MRDIARNDLVILDEFGYVPLDLDSARLLLREAQPGHHHKH